MPSYNQGRFIEESIRSVLLQGYPDLEFLIIDAGSTDESVEIIQKYAPWLAYWVSEPDRGQSHAINKGLEKSTGTFFNWHNADDLLTPNSLAMTASALGNYPEASYVHGYRIIIDQDTKQRRNTKETFAEKIDFVPALKESIAHLTGGMQPGCLMQRALVCEEGGIDENLHYIMDRDILLRLALQRPPLYIPQSVVFLREHADAKSFSWSAEQANERFLLAQKIFSRPVLPSEIRALQRTALAAAHRFAWKCYAKAGTRGQALRHLGMDILYSPSGGWSERRRIIKALARQYSSKWLYRLYVIMKRAEKLHECL